METKGQSLASFVIKRWHLPATNFAALIVSTGFFYLLIWACFDVTAGLGKQFSSVVFIFFFANIGGKILELLGLPPLTGMIIIGFGFGNIPGMERIYQIDEEFGSSLRTLAFTFVLTLAGLGLDTKTIRSMALSIFLLSLSPCLAEGLTIMLASHFIMGLPWLWALTMGFVVANVSLGVLVPGMLFLHDRGYGRNKEMLSFVVGTATVDNIIGITLFNVFFSTIFSTGSLALVILSGPINILIGVALGGVIGVAMWYIPHQTADHAAVVRSVILIFTTLFVLFGTAKLGYSGAGPLGCLTLSIVVAYRWRMEPELFNSVKYSMRLCWYVAQPILFGTTGSNIVFSEISPRFGGKAIGIILIALILRLTTAFLVTAKSRLNLKERVFIAIAWFPKASVQASIGGLALDKVLSSQKGESVYERNLKYGRMILSVSVICIILTAPFGAILVQKFGSYLLAREKEDAEHIDNTNL